MDWIFWTLMCVWVLYNIYSIIRTNKVNGLFDYTVFQMYLKEKGLSDEEIDRELDNRARLHNQLSDAIGFKALTENQYREKNSRIQKKEQFKIDISCVY